MSGATADHLALRLLQVHPEEAAALLEQHAPEAAAALLAATPPDTAAGVMRRLLPSYAWACLGALPPERAAAVLEKLDPDDAVAPLRRAESEARDALIERLPRRQADAVRRLLRHAPGSAGALMDPLVGSLPDDLTVEQAVSRLRERPEHGAYYLYVVDREGRLVGVLNYRDLALSERGKRLAAVMRSPVTSMPASTAGEELADHPGWRGLFALPVVDASGVLLGALRFETVHALVQEEAQPRPSLAARIAARLWALLGLGRRRGEST